MNVHTFRDHACWIGISGEVPGQVGVTSTRLERLIAALLFSAGAILLFLSAPHHGEFWWSDAPRHALNGALIRDMFASLPWRDPVGFATQYYGQYPALTILFYPPLFYFVLAPFYAVLGVSNATALIVVLVCYFAFAYGLFVLARRWLPAGLAIAVGLLAMSVPGIALWGRQVMLEVPTLAFAVWASVLLRRYLDNERPWLLYLGAFVLLCAVYTKITAIFLVPVLALMLLAQRGKSIWRDKHVWAVAILFVVGLVPICLLTLKFGHANVQSVTGIPDAAVSRATLRGWFWYAQQFPSQLSWLVLIAAAAYPLLRFATGCARPSLRLSDFVLLVGWFAIGYAFFSLIDLKEARHSTLILPPFLLAAAFSVNLIPFRHISTVLALVLVCITGYDTLRHAPVPAVAGYREAASWIAANAPRNAIVLFSGYRDGSFIFNLRSFEDRRDLYTIRADKLLLEVAVRRELGVKEKALNPNEIGALLDRLGVRYVVAQRDFWTDLQEMSRLQTVLESEQFQEQQRINVVSNVPVTDKELRIYRNLHGLAPGQRELKLELPIINRNIRARIGGSDD